MSTKKEGKITLGMLKGKPVTTSVPSISIKFHANAEQLEELYVSDDEQTASEVSGGSTGAAGTSEPESSPLKYLPRLVKRSTSIDITPNAHTDASPPSDPWRFFSDIKGKITKSVEEKITEIKSRNQEEGSPLRNRTVKDSKDNSSVSDSEDLSESSISKTCGIVSTTEGAEMSSDDDTPSIEKDKKTEDRAKSSSTTLRQRFRLLKPKASNREGTITKKSLSTFYNINTDKIEQALVEESEIESAVDALEDTNLDSKILKDLEDQFDNFQIDDDDVINVKEVAGCELKNAFGGEKTVYAPIGFVDLRNKPTKTQSGVYLPFCTLAILVFGYAVIHQYSSYLAGFIIGIIVTYLLFYTKNILDSPSGGAVMPTQEIVQVQAVKEFQPLTKYEGWVNEFPETYNPHTYHISQTQSIFLRLQGHLLRVSHTRTKIPKRALWNEPKIKPTFTHHRVYNLTGAQVTLLPEGLAKKRLWSKKYPICVTLNKDQMDFEPAMVPSATNSDDTSSCSVGKKRRWGGGRKKRSHTLRFSKLCEENEEFDLDSENSRGSSPSPLSQDDSEGRAIDDETRKAVDDKDEDDKDVFVDEEFENLPEDWGTLSPPDDDSPAPTKLYIFGRTDREKEDWFRRLTVATHRSVTSVSNESTNSETSTSHILQEKAMNESDYVKYMSIFNKTQKRQKPEGGESIDDSTPSGDIQWINAFVGRVLFDCFRDDSFAQAIKDRIQRKLASIKLPYFIEGLSVTELSLGQTPPLIHKASKPILDERGLWIDLDVTYEGLVVLILQTKLNLMKLKQPHDSSRSTDRPAMFNSDVEDSAESTSDEETMALFPNPPDNAPLTPPSSGSTNTSKKFMKMVDRIAESKFFQAATEYRYIKKAMEGVSNTDLRLKVEVKELVGTLVLNLPAPPSDRVWIGFRPTPTLGVVAQPIVGERNITSLRITSWIEKKLLLEFQKLMVIPNMEDFIVPVMCPKLPE